MGDEEDELLSLGSDSEPDSGLDKSPNKVNSVTVGMKSRDTPTKSYPAKLAEHASVSDSESDDEGYSAVSRVNAVVNRQNTEVTLSDDDDEEPEAPNAGESTGSTTSSQESHEEQGSASRYGLRRKRKINYTEIENGPLHDDQDAQLNKQQAKKDVFDVFSLPNERIKKIILKPELIDNFTKCKITFGDGTDSERLSQIEKFFEKCGHQFESIFVHTRYDEESLYFLKSILAHTSSLGKLDYRYHNKADSLNLLKLLKKLREDNHLAGLHSLKLVGLSGENNLTEKHMNIISKLDVNFTSLELGDALWEDVQASTLEKLLERQKATLESLVIHGGFRGDTDKTRVLITFPKMEKLTNLCICPSYTFLSEIKDPHSKRARIISLDVGGREEPYKIAIKFSTDIPTLNRLVLGNLIEIEDLLFSTIRRVKTFRCGSYWNLPMRFPLEGSRKALTESDVTELQFPDALKDPSFTVKVAKYFPNLKKVWMFLPSVPVLRAFFKAFENSNLEELYLKTQFDFESTMESCLLPNMSDVLRRSPATNTLLETLKEYKHFDEYVRYYNLELPVEADDLMEGHSAGIRALKNLKILHLEHIPRRLLIPNPDDERKWYDHNFKFMNSTFGYQKYPLNYRCHKEILRLDLSEYVWKNVDIETEFRQEFHVAGFVDIPEVQVIQDLSGYTPIEEDLFVPVQRNRGSGAQVKIMPSMLFAEVKVKPEGS